MVLAIAHRGSRVLWPENTLIAFRGAVELGFRWLETDLHLTSDGRLICFHDDTADRTTDGSGPVASMKWEEISALDAGFRHAPRQGFPFREQGVRVPAFDELVSEFPHVNLVVDLKQDGIEEALAFEIARLGIEGRLIVGSFSDQRLVRFREITEGRVRTSTGSAESRQAWARSWFGTPEKLAHAVQLPRVHVGLPIINKRTVAGFHRAGYEVHVWTVNRVRSMNRLIDWGVDGIISDRPDLLRSVLERRGLWQ